MSAKRGHWALCNSRVVAFGKILGLRVSVAVSPHAGATKTPYISYANVHNYYGPYTYCSLDKGVACAEHIQLLTHTCVGHMC